MTTPCHVAVGEGYDGICYVSLATETSIMRLTADEARALAAQLVRVTDLWEQHFKVEWKVSFSGPLARP